MTKKKKPSTSPKVFGSQSETSNKTISPVLDNNSLSDKSQDSLSPTFTEVSELEKKFTPKHKKSLVLSDIYFRLGHDKKSERVCSCGDFLEFAHEVDSYGSIHDKGKLHKAYFCRDRFCPMCTWRRSLKLYANVSQCIPKITKNYKCIFLTLTVPNCTQEAFTETIDRLMKAWYKLSHYKKFSKVVKGFFRVLEVTRNKDKSSEFYGTLHPHFHIILVVPKEYGGKGLYISRNDFLEMWKKAYDDDSITQVDIRVIKPKENKELQDMCSSPDLIPLKSLESAVAETCKYTFKDSDFLDDSLSQEEQDNLLLSLMSGLHHRRLAHFGGVFKEIYNSLGLEDVEDDSCDLTHIEDSINKGVALLITRFHWGYGCYEFLDKKIVYNKEDEVI